MVHACSPSISPTDYMTPTIEWIDSTPSTNALISADSSDGYTIAARCQTAGRGQRGNHWEAEPGLNLTFSMCLKPQQIEAARQFELSMLIALAIADVLGRTIADYGGDPDDVKVKWPNDIYWRDRKLVGILIENSLYGRRIGHSVVGVGINVNQREFLSDAPNPVSLYQICGHTLDLEPLLEECVREVVNSLGSYEATLATCAVSSPQTRLLGEYRKRLWRGTGFHPYREAATGRRFDAAITAIDPAGNITLTDRQGHSHTYAFKEVAALLS